MLSSTITKQSNWRKQDKCAGRVESAMVIIGKCEECDGMERYIHEKHQSPALVVLDSKK